MGWAFNFGVFVAASVVEDVEQAFVEVVRRSMEMGFDSAIFVFDDETQVFNVLSRCVPEDFDMAEGQCDGTVGV